MPLMDCDGTIPFWAHRKVKLVTKANESGATRRRRFIQAPEGSLYPKFLSAIYGEIKPNYQLEQ